MILNPYFTDPGEAPGEADEWETLSLVLAWAIAGLGVGDADPGFERFTVDWLVDTWSTTLESAELAEWEQGGESENFERFWSNNTWAVDFGSLVEALFNGADNAEGFESAWSNDDWTTILDGLLAQFDNQDGGPAKNVENFEKYWFNDSWSSSLIAADFATFIPGPMGAEIFHWDSWPDVRMTTL